MSSLWLVQVQCVLGGGRNRKCADLTAVSESASIWAEGRCAATTYYYLAWAEHQQSVVSVFVFNLVATTPAER